MSAQRPTLETDDSARLDEFNKDEMREAARKLRPDLTDGEFDVMWDGFVEMKKQKGLQ